MVFMVKIGLSGMKVNAVPDMPLGIGTGGCSGGFRKDEE